MSANERQVAGSHYKAGFQHWDLMAFNHVDYFAAQATKYVTRWQKKNGVQDVEKSMHYHEKLTELLQAGVLQFPAPRTPLFLEEFREANNLGDLEFTIFTLLLTYTTFEDLYKVGVLLQHLMQDAKGRELAARGAN